MLKSPVRFESHSSFVRNENIPLHPLLSILFFYHPFFLIDDEYNFCSHSPVKTTCLVFRCYANKIPSQTFWIVLTMNYCSFYSFTCNVARHKRVSEMNISCKILRLLCEKFKFNFLLLRANCVGMESLWTRKKGALAFNKVNKSPGYLHNQTEYTRSPEVDRFFRPAGLCGATTLLHPGPFTVAQCPENISHMRGRDNMDIFGSGQRIPTLRVRFGSDSAPIKLYIQNGRFFFSCC